MRNQKGQAVVEFAVVLPLFLLVLFGIIYSGMLFYDYSSLSNLARSGAREAAISQNITTNIGNIENHYKGFIVDGEAGQNRLITSLYIPADTDRPVVVSYDKDDESVGVTITMKLNTASALMQMVLPKEYKIEYFMKRDDSST